MIDTRKQYLHVRHVVLYVDIVLRSLFGSSFILSLF